MSNREGDEYQFSDDEVRSDSLDEDTDRPYTPSNPGSINPELTQRARRITLVVIVIIIGFVVLHFFGGKKGEADKKESVPALNITDTSKEKSVAVDQPDTQADTATPTSTPIETVLQRMAELHQKFMADDSRVYHLEVAVHNIEQAVNNIGSSISDMNLQVQAILKKVQLLEKMSTQSQAKKVVVRRYSSHPKKVYHLTAVVVGRAWIRDALGHEMTITLGDTIPDYGQVNSINPNQGMIGTTSGRVITYGQDDA